MKSYLARSKIIKPLHAIKYFVTISNIKPISANLIQAKYVEYGLDERYLVLFAYIVMQMYTYLSGFYFNKNTL